MLIQTRLQMARERLAWPEAYKSWSRQAPILSSRSFCCTNHNRGSSASTGKDTIKRYGGSTDPQAPWPREVVEDRSFHPCHFL